MTWHIIHQDPNFLIIDKPSGLPTHPFKPGEEALSTLLVQQFHELATVGPDPNRPGIVHRLDKETSGLLIVARTNKAYECFRKQFDQGKVKKEYLALAYGEVKKDEGTISLAIGRTKKGPFAAGQPEATRPARTQYKVLQRLKEFTLLSLKPLTGRTHQLRVHLKAIGHPIVGDPLYRAKIKHRIEFPRLFLHATKIGFFDLQEQWRGFASPLPSELKNFLGGLALSN